MGGDVMRNIQALLQSNGITIVEIDKKIAKFTHRPKPMLKKQQILHITQKGI